MSKWKRLHNEGVLLAQGGDFARARAAFEAAYRVAAGNERAATLVNLAGTVDLTGDPDRAARLLTEAVGLAVREQLPVVLASRADVLMRLGRWDEAWQDTERGLADADPAHQAVLRNVRTGLLMAAGRLAEAESEALAAVELATAHAPQLTAQAYTNLVGIAEAAGDAERAAEYRKFVEAPEGVRTIGPRWHRCVALNSQGAMLAASGDMAGALAAFRAAYAETEGSDDVEALVCRAAVAGNLTGAEQSLYWAGEAVTAGREVLARVGDAYGTSGVLVNALVSRAELLRHVTRLDEALADLDEAVGLAGAQPSIVAVRASVLAAAGRFGEAAAEARTALDLAYATAPQLAPFVHTTLAEIANLTGDNAGSAEHHGLARDLAQATGDVNTQATAVLSLARLAYLEVDNDRAATLYDEAEALLNAIGDRRRLVVCRHGRAAVEMGRGRPRAALALLDGVLEALGDSATPAERIAFQQVRGSALEAVGEFAAADQCYGEATETASRAGLWHVALGTAWWRADALLRRRAASTDEAQRRVLAEQALDHALPAALAAEAVRQRFAHGPLREQWVALAAAPAVRTAFLAMGAVNDAELIASYMDHLAATVSLSPTEDRQLSRDDLVVLPLPVAVADDELPYAASFMATAGDDPAFPATGFALPPRVRLDPAVPSTLDGWIDVAERRYGFPVRSEQAVASW